MPIIGINGRMGHGKDTVGNIIQYLTSPVYKNNLKSFEEFQKGETNPHRFGGQLNPDWEIKKYAKKLKQVASLLTGIPENKFEDQEFKKSFLNKEWDTIEVRNLPVQKQDGWNIKVEKEAVFTKMTVREFLQKLGTDAIRKGLHDQTWVNALFADYRPSSDYFSDVANGREGDIELYYPKWIITDVRFPNELSAIKERKGITIRVIRPIPNTSDHISETALDDYSFDYEIVNDGSIDDLIEKVKVFIEKYNII